MLNENEITIINFDKSKRRKNLLRAVGLIAVCVLFIGIIISAEVIKIYYLAFFVLLLVIMTVMLIKAVVEMNSKDQVGLLLNQDGITFNGTSAAKKIGQISWADIENFKLMEAYRTKQLYLKFKNPQKYIKEKSKLELANYGVFLNSGELEISFEELTSLTAKYLDKYGDASSPRL